MATRRGAPRNQPAAEEAAEGIGGGGATVPPFVRTTVIESLAVASLQQWHYLNDDRDEDETDTKTCMPNNWWKDIRDNSIYQSMGISDTHVRNRFRRLRAKQASAEEDQTGTEEGNTPAAEADGAQPTGNDTATVTTETTPLESSRPAGGRPKGSTNEKKEQLNRNRTAAVTEATKAFVEAKSKAEGPLPKGELERIIATAKKNNNVPDDTVISNETIRTRAKRNAREPKNTQSPMEEIEPLLLAIHHACYFANIYFNEKKFLRLANDIIKGTELEKRVIQWKVENSHFKPTEGGGAQLGRGYWQGFRRRHADEIENAKAKKKAKAAKDYATYANFLFAYGEIYEYMEKWGLAEKLQEAQYQNIDGERVDDEKDAFGCIVEYYLTLPEWILVFDETGNSTNQDKLSNSMERGSVPKGMPLVESVEPNDRHYTIIPFNNLLGQLVCVTIIFAHTDEESIPSKWGCPIDWFRFDEFYKQLDEAEQEKLLEFMKNAEDEQEQIDYLYQHFGEDAKSIIHDGVGVMYNGQRIPYFKATSPKGSVTGKILTGTLKMLDDLEVFKRTNDHPAPMLICDGHGSRFDLDFLEYTCNKKTRWLVVHGVPGCTSLWQAGDSSQMNGHFKVRVQQAETEYSLLKGLYGLATNITHCDVIPILSKAIPITFGVTANCKKAIAERGWNPLNKALLKLPEIRATQVEIDYLAENTTTNSPEAANDERSGDESVNETQQEEEQPEQEPVNSDADDDARDRNTVAHIVNQTNVADNTGFSGALLAEIFMRTEVQLKKEKKNAKRRAGLARAFQRTHKKITAGTNFFHGGSGTGTCIIDERMRDKKRRRAARQKKKEEDAAKAKKDQSTKLLKAVKVALRKQQAKETLKVPDLKALCNWKRIKGKEGDGNLPSRVGDLKLFFDRIKERPEPAWPSLDDSSEDDEDDDDADAMEQQQEDAVAMQEEEDDSMDEQQQEVLDDIAARLEGVGDGDEDDSSSSSEDDEEDEHEARRARKRQRYETGNQFEGKSDGEESAVSVRRVARRKKPETSSSSSSDAETEPEKASGAAIGGLMSMESDTDGEDQDV